MAWATILTEAFPGQRRELMEYGRQLGADTIIAGSHYSTDVVAGQKLGAEIARRLLADADFKARMERVKDECQD